MEGGTNHDLLCLDNSVSVGSKDVEKDRDRREVEEVMEGEGVKEGVKQTEGENGKEGKTGDSLSMLRRYVYSVLV